MKFNRIAVDHDDVLFPTTPILNIFHNHKYKKNLSFDDYTVFDFSKIWGIPPENVRKDEREFYASHLYASMEAIEGAVEVVEYLAKESELSVLTGRGKDVESSTLYSLGKEFKPHHFSGVHHLGQRHSDVLPVKKWEKCIEHQFKLLIDDYHHHLILAAQYGICGILMHAPWNKNITDLPSTVKRARNLNEAVEIIEKW